MTNDSNSGEIDFITACQRAGNGAGVLGSSIVGFAGGGLIAAITTLGSVPEALANTWNSWSSNKRETQAQTIVNACDNVCRELEIEKIKLFDTCEKLSRDNIKMLNDGVTKLEVLAGEMRKSPPRSSVELYEDKKYSHSLFLLMGQLSLATSAGLGDFKPLVTAVANISALEDGVQKLVEDMRKKTGHLAVDKKTQYLKAEAALIRVQLAVATLKSPVTEPARQYAVGVDLAISNCVLLWYSGVGDLVSNDQMMKSRVCDIIINFKDTLEQAALLFRFGKERNEQISKNLNVIAPEPAKPILGWMAVCDSPRHMEESNFKPIHCETEQEAQQALANLPNAPHKNARCMHRP